MKLHEYQAKNLLRERGVFTLNSQICFTLDEAITAMDSIGYPCVIKAQVHAGGRGKAGGVKLASSRNIGIKYVKDILGMIICTAQTNENGQKVNAILIEEACDIKSELYISFLIDRSKGQICLISSLYGGMDIEDIASKNPDYIHKIYIKKSLGLMPYQLRELFSLLKISNPVRDQFLANMLGIYHTFIDCDASMIEINPLVIDNIGRIIALDAKMIIDDNSLYRQKNISEMRDESQEDEREILAQHHNLSYVALDGNIGCMVNGAGLAMATMDMIKSVGGSPANFLDVGGSATKEKVIEALRIIVLNTKVKSILVNVFGGIAQCDVIASGVIDAYKSLNLSLPLIVRLEGTNVAKGQEILKNSGLAIVSASDMLDGARLAVMKAGA